MTTRSQLQQVQPLHVHDLNPRNVPECLHETGPLGPVDDQWTLPVDVPAVSHLALAGTDCVAVLGLLGVGIGTDLLQNPESRRGFLNTLGRVADDEGQLGDGLDAVAAGEDEGRDSGGGDGRNDGIALEIDVNLAVPAPPDLSGGEHAAATAHVAEGGLASAVGTPSGDAGYTGHGAPGSPRLGGGLVARALRHGVGLSFVL